MVAVSGLQANAPTFAVGEGAFGGVGDGFVDGLRVDLQSVEGDVIAAHVKGVEAVSETVLTDGDGDTDGVLRAVEQEGVGAGFDDPHRHGAFDDYRIDAGKGNGVGGLFFDEGDGCRRGALFASEGSQKYQGYPEPGLFHGTLFWRVRGRRLWGQQVFGGKEAPIPWDVPMACEGFS